MLPGSTERAVTISGKFDSIVECFKLVASIMLEVVLSFRSFYFQNVHLLTSNYCLLKSPPKGDTLSYKPKQVAVAPPINTPVIFAHGQAYQVQGQYAIPLPPHEVAKLVQMGALSQIQPTGPIPGKTIFLSFFFLIFI